jgi:ABC-type sugar transport system ATPase subunit
MIRCENICWAAGDFVLQNVCFEVPPRSYAVLMGRSGSGKSSLLEILCGLRTPLSGRVFLDGVDATCLPPAKRRLGYVPQDSALFPTYSVRENLEFAPLLQGCNRSEVRERVARLAEQLEIAHLLNRQPGQLSGGERQRTALGRALAAQPRILLLDEPLSALDEDLQTGLRTLLRSIHQAHPLTVLHVTHSRAEAQQLADVRFSLDAGMVHAS